jgi:hypothetical protein
VGEEEEACLTPWAGSKATDDRQPSLL